MSPTQLRDLIFDLLYAHMQGDAANAEPEQFVGVQGPDTIIVMQKGGPILGLRVVERRRA